MTIQLYHGDCLEFMRTLPDQSVDLVWTDPPYNVGKDYGDYKDNLPEAEYFQWCELWLGELKRVSKQIAICPPKKHFRWFWNQLSDNHQIICSWAPSGAIRSNFVHQYIPILVPPKPNRIIKDHWWNVQVPGLGYFFREDTYDHPGYTSMDITARVISAFTKPGDVVLDCFLGTGTTGVVAVRYGCNFIGCERESNWIELAQNRIADAVQAPALLQVPVESDVQPPLFP